MGTSLEIWQARLVLATKRVSTADILWAGTTRTWFRACPTLAKQWSSCERTRQKGPFMLGVRKQAATRGTACMVAGVAQKGVKPGIHAVCCLPCPEADEGRSNPRDTDLGFHNSVIPGRHNPANPEYPIMTTYIVHRPSRHPRVRE
jgi:hypothetical protein